MTAEHLKSSVGQWQLGRQWLDVLSRFSLFTDRWRVLCRCWVKHSHQPIRAEHVRVTLRRRACQTELRAEINTPQWLWAHCRHRTRSLRFTSDRYARTLKITAEWNQHDVISWELLNTSDPPQGGSGSGSYLIMFSMLCSLTLMSADKNRSNNTF